MKTSKALCTSLHLRRSPLKASGRLIVRNSGLRCVWGPGGKPGPATPPANARSTSCRCNAVICARSAATCSAIPASASAHSELFSPTSVSAHCEPLVHVSFSALVASSLARWSQSLLLPRPRLLKTCNVNSLLRLFETCSPNALPLPRPSGRVAQTRSATTNLDYLNPAVYGSLRSARGFCSPRNPTPINTASLSFSP